MAYIDAFATARGNAFTATAGNASAVFYNGAGLTQLEGTQIHGSVTALSLDYSSDTVQAKTTWMMSGKPSPASEDLKALTLRSLL